MTKLRVKLKDNPYDIVISKKYSDFSSAVKKVIKSGKIFIITDTNVAKLHLKDFANILKKAGFESVSTVVPSGEKGKTVKVLSSLYDKALKEGIDRKSYVIALGGGVVGDVAGFFAATYMRGIKFVQVPTTLLAMSDSSVGGKTGVNITGGKNIAGVFYQPSLVWINPMFLITLPERQIKNGLAEIMKCAFAFDKEFYAYILKMIKSGIISESDFSYMIYKSCGHKALIVEKDEKETTGKRELLNFGHTLAHALETYTEYKHFLHGEAVAIGMLFAAKLSAELKYCSKEVYRQVKEFLMEAGFVFSLKDMNAVKLTELMKKDKKSIGGEIRFVLLKKMGKAQSRCFVKDSIVTKYLKAFMKENK